MDRAKTKQIVESLLYMTDHPLSAKEIAGVLELKSIPAEKIEEFIQELKAEFGDRKSGLDIISVAGGYQVATRPEVASWVRKLYKERLTVRLSASALETLSIIAYKQPISRSEIEQIRGVEATGVMDTLIERRLVRVVGRKETIGRPLLYGTSQEFLRQFGLNHLGDLPDLSEVPVQLEQPEQVHNSPVESEALIKATAEGDKNKEREPEEKIFETPPSA